MADTIPDILATTNEYVNVNTLTSITAGTALVITNKSTNKIRVQISNTQPADDSTDGELLSILPAPTAIKLISAGENAVWVQATEIINSPISVQDNS